MSDKHHHSLCLDWEKTTSVYRTRTGEIGFFDSQNRLVQKFDLRNTTEHTGSEDIEIRSIWADGFDELVFAASSWGNDAS